MIICLRNSTKHERRNNKMQKANNVCYFGTTHQYLFTLVTQLFFPLLYYRTLDKPLGIIVSIISPENEIQVKKIKVCRVCVCVSTTKYVGTLKVVTLTSK